MKDKDGNNPEDVLAQLSNSRLPETVLLSLYSKLNCINLSNVQRLRALKTINTHFVRDATSAELQKAALEAGFSIIRSDLTSSSNAITGASYTFLEACRRIVAEYAENVNSQDILSVSKALEILSHSNVSTVSKLFHDRGGITLEKVIKLCLEKDSLQLHSLSLLNVALSVSESDQISKPIIEDENAVIQLVYPLLFTLENDMVRAAALAAMKKMNLSTKSEPFWNKLKENTKKIYYKQMVEMVNRKQNWPVIWQFVVNMFGEELQTGCQMINQMLEVLERAFKHSDFEWTRVQAFECWNTLIDNFRCGLKNKKRIELIMIPLKANNHRIETLASAKLHTYVHLLRALGKDLVSYPDIVLSFISFCFGSEKSTIPPVRSYPALHEICVDALKELLMSPCMQELFTKVHKELMQAVGDCFLMENISLVSLQDIWNRLLDLLSTALLRTHDTTETLKNLFYVVQKVVHQAGNGDTSASFKFRRSLSPTAQNSPNKQPDKHLGKKIVLIVLDSMVRGKFALKRNLLRNRSLYIGSYDVMTGTPAFLFVEWLLTPALMLGAGDSPVFQELISLMTSVRLEEPTGFMDYVQLVLKKLSALDDTISANKKMCECVADVWCILVKKLVEFIQDQGSINQGNAAEHDFRALYAVLLFPAQNLYSEFEFIEKCSGPWKSLFYEAYEQAALVPTASSQELSEQICTRLAAASKRSKSPKQISSVYCLLTCILQVASDKFKSSKRYRSVQECVSSVLRDLEFPLDQELVYCQSVACVQRCLLPNPASMKVVENVSPVFLSLLKSKVNLYDSIDRFCLLLSDLRKATLFLLQRGESKGSVKALLKNILTYGKSHFSQKVRSCIRELQDSLENKRAPEMDNESQDSTPLKKLSTGSAFSPSNRPASSPKQAVKKFTIQISPSNKSPGSVKKRTQNGLTGSDVKFVRIETPPKKIILTDHQKEVRRERREDIPALYQDLSQDTQSVSQDASQDFVPLPSSPKAKSQVPLNEDAIMDIIDADEAVQAISVKRINSSNGGAKSDSPQGLKKEHYDFTPPAGFVLPSSVEGAASSSDPVPIENEIRLRKENDNISSPVPEKLTKNSRRGTLTRSSSNESPTTTRSGKVLKRNSLASAESEHVLKRKSARKSLPLNCSEDQSKKCIIETIVIDTDTTDTESVSSVTSDASSTNSKLPRKRGRPPKATVQATLDNAKEAGNKACINQESDSSAAKVLHTRKDGSDSANKSFSTSDQSSSASGKVTSVKKLIGGKILTRNRSNSNLDEVVGLKKKQNGGVEDNQTNSTVKPNESTSQKVGENTGVKSPTSKTSSGGSFESPFYKVPRRSRSKHELTENLSEDNGSMRSVNDASLGELSLAVLNEVQKDQCAESTTSVSCPIPLSNNNRKKTDNCSEDINYASGLEQATEESQEIIESSQEPLINLLKPCAVSLEPFLGAEPNKRVEIDNVIVLKGPEKGSPYKICPKNDIDVTEKAQSPVCRSLALDNACGTESPSANIFLRISEAWTPRSGRDQTSNVQDSKFCKSASSPKLSVSDESSDSKDDASKRTSSSEGETSEIVTVNHEKLGDGKDDNTMLSDDVNPQNRNGCMPEWMHVKKNSPSSKPRHFRSLSARSQVFMKSVKEVELNLSPPKGIEISPVSSPVQHKKASKANAESTINTTPTIKRSSRAEKLLGLGQAAAARGGETVLSNVAQSLSDKMNEEGSETSMINTNNSNSSHIVAPSATLNATNGTNNVLNSIHIATATAVASPSVQRQGKVSEVDSLKYTPQKCLEDKGLREEWIRRTPCPEATPDSGILKRRREDDDVPSPSMKRKRVSFRDPPLSSFLKFNESLDAPGTVFSADWSADKADKVVEPVNVNQDGEGRSRTKRNDLDKCEDQGDSHCTSSERLTAYQHDNNKGIDFRETSEKSSPVSMASGDYDSSSAKSNTLQGAINTKGNSKAVNVSAGLFDEHNKRKSSDSHVGSTEDNGAGITVNSRSVPERDVEIEEDLCGHDKLQECSELTDLQTQGSIEDLHHKSSLSSPLYPALSLCSHSVECLTSKLTSSVWKSSLSRELLEKEIRTVGDLASLTEEKLDRLPVKQPKKDNVVNILQIFEKQHNSLRDGVPCCLLPESNDLLKNSEDKLMDVLCKASDEEILETLTNLGRKSQFSQTILHSLDKQDIAAVVAGNQSFLRSLPIDSVAETYISEVSKSTGHNEKNMKAQDIHAILRWIPNNIILEALFSKMSLSEIVQNLDQKKSNDMLEILALNLKNPSKHLKEALLQKMSSSDIAEELDPKKSEDLLETLVCNVKTPSKHLREVLFSKMSSEDIVQEFDEKISKDVLKTLVSTVKDLSEHFSKLFLSKLNSSDIVRNLEQRKAEDVLEALVCKMEKPSKRLREQLFSNLSSSDIVKELDETKSDDLLQALACRMRKPSKHLRQVLLSKMNSSDIVEELDEKKSEDLLETLIRNIKKPTKALKEVLISKMSSSDIAMQLDDKKSEELLENLGSSAKKISKQFVKTCILKISQLDIAEELDQSNSEKLIEALLCNINEPSKEVKDALLSKITPSDIANSDSIRSEEICKAILSQLNWKKTVSLLVEHGQHILKDAD